MARKTPAGQEGDWTKAIEPDGSRKSVSEPVARRVWIAAGGRCTFCGRNLLLDETTGQPILIGQLAHIVGATKGVKSPRGNHDLSEKARAEADNLMLLCYDQHHVIDDKSMWDLYDVDTLRRFKREHEDRINRLTAMSAQHQRTVLRVVGDVGGIAIDLSRDTVARALLERGTFPDFQMLGVGAEYEIDLRHLPGAAPTAAYWAAGAEVIDNRVAALRSAVTAGHVGQVAVLAVARIPLLVALGNALGEALPLELYPVRKSGAGGFGWSDESTPVEFITTEIQHGEQAGKVAVLISVTGSIDRSRLPTDATWTIYELSASDGTVGPGLDRSQATIDNFRAAWAGLLAELEQHDGLRTVSLFAAVPVSAAITLGRCLIRGRSPALEVHDLTADGHYELMLTVRRS